MEHPTREQFVAAYLTLPGTTQEMGQAVYDLLAGPLTVELLAGIDDVCVRVVAPARQEGGDE